MNTKAQFCIKSKRFCCALIALNSITVVVILYYAIRQSKLRIGTDLAYKVNPNVRPCDNAADDWVMLRFLDDSDEHRRASESSAGRDVAASKLFGFEEKVIADGGDDFYVTLDVTKCDKGRRLGNQLFAVAAVISAARLTGRQAVLPSRCVDSFFAYFNSSASFTVTPVRRPSNVSEQASSTASVGFSSLSSFFRSPSSVPPCRCYVFHEKAAMTYDDRFVRTLTTDADATSSRCLVLDGYFQSWRYLDDGKPDRSSLPGVVNATRRAVASGSLRRFFTFSNELRDYAAGFLKRRDTSLPKVGNHSRNASVIVGVHVRRADMTWPVHIRMGYEPPGANFFTAAIKYFIDRHLRVRFVVCSDDMKWARENVIPSDISAARTLSDRNHTKSMYANSTTSSTTEIIYCEGRSPGHDLAVLADCDHVIVSAGTFGWWAGWLADGTTLYYGKWPRDGTKLSAMFRREDYYPPRWIPISD